LLITRAAKEQLGLELIVLHSDLTASLDVRSDQRHRVLVTEQRRATTKVPKTRMPTTARRANDATAALRASVRYFILRRSAEARRHRL
jgi:hypothetical protein